MDAEMNRIFALEYPDERWNSERHVRAVPTTNGCSRDRMPSYGFFLLEAGLAFGLSEAT
jgi:hypothetical protein